MIVFKATMAFFIGIAVLLDLASAHIAHSDNDRTEFWCGIALVVAAVMQLFALVHDTNYILMGASCGFIVTAAIYVFGLNLRDEYVRHVTKKDIRINNIEMENDHLKAVNKGLSYTLDNIRPIKIHPKHANK